MVGSITFSKKEGDHVKKGEEVNILYLMSFLWFYILFIYRQIMGWCILSWHCVHLLQFGYFSFGGSTVICVFEKVGVWMNRGWINVVTLLFFSLFGLFLLYLVRKQVSYVLRIDTSSFCFWHSSVCALSVRFRLFSFMSCDVKWDMGPQKQMVRLLFWDYVRTCENFKDF